MRPALHHIRSYPEVHRRPEFDVSREVEGCRHHPDDFEAPAIEPQSFSDQRRIAAETPLPQPVTEHHYLIAARLFVLEQKRTADRRVDPQRLKEVSRGCLALQPLRVAGSC